MYPLIKNAKNIDIQPLSMHIIRDSEKVFSDFGSNPFMAIGGGEPSAKWESDNALNIRKIVEKNCCKCKSKIRNKWFFYQASVS